MRDSEVVHEEHRLEQSLLLLKPKSLRRTICEDSLRIFWFTPFSVARIANLTPTSCVPEGLTIYCSESIKVRKR
jgi:hypothetical protein